MNTQYEEKLTPAAKEALNDLVMDYRNRIITRASEAAAEIDGAVKEISVKDLFIALNTDREKTSKVVTRSLDRFIILIALVGLIYSLIGFGFYGFEHYKNIIENTGLITGISGLAVSILGFLLLFIVKNIRTKESLERVNATMYDIVDPYELIKIWQKIEIQTKLIIASKLGESKANIPLIYALRRLKDMTIITEIEYNALLNLLDMRNKVLHSDKIYSESDMKNIVQKSEQILRKLKAST
jgi:hypothetical protein